MTKLAKAQSSYYGYSNPYSNTAYYTAPRLDVIDGDNNLPPGSIATSIPNSLSISPRNYREELQQCRFFYKFDPTASTVINRMSEMAASTVRNRRGRCTDEEYFFYSSLSDRITRLIRAAALEYFVAGMAVPDYGIVKQMGSRLHTELGRTRYSVPEPMWVRNPENIVLRKLPTQLTRSVYLRIPQEDKEFIQNGGITKDGAENKQLYNMLLKNFPDYVRAIKEGKTLIHLPNSRPILRKAMAGSDYPQPFLVPALAAMKHKLRIKEMDHNIASRAIEAILLIKAGNDEYPITEDDTTLDDMRKQLSTRGPNDLIYTLYTNHTIDAAWVYPPLEALLSDKKYEAVDADIFMAMGFSRVLLVGESNRSNAGAGGTTILGPLTTLEQVRSEILDWIHDLYVELADLNGFANIPDPLFDPLTMTDASTQMQYASVALKDNVISLDTYAQLFGKSFESEARQRISEQDVMNELIDVLPTPEPVKPAPISPTKPAVKGG